jgi:NADPH-dependent 2,4-dienoyl-CoA reductase/sulfur reductase-like enzyme
LVVSGYFSRSPVFSYSNLSSINIVFIGGVACGPKAAARAKRLVPQANITIIEQGSALPYAGCGMPYYLSGRVPELRELMSTSIVVKVFDYNLVVPV